MPFLMTILEKLIVKKAIIIIICLFASIMAGRTDREESVDPELFSRNLELMIENNRYENFLFQKEEKAICIYEGTIDLDKEYDKFAIYKETAPKDIVFVNMLFVHEDSGSIYTWEGEDLVLVGVWENNDFRPQDALETEKNGGLLYENITADELLCKVMEVLEEDGNGDFKLMYDGIRDFLNKKYYVISAFDDLEDHIIRTQTYYVDMEQGNVYRADENDESLRTELYYEGKLEPEA